jgi:hypothetical protein
MANFHSMNSGRFPQRGVEGDAYFASDTKKIFICIAGGVLVPLEGLLNVRVVEGARGEKGDTGAAGGIGPHGLQGPAGRDGIDGKSVSGPKGPRGAQGPQGIPGKDGRDGIDGKGGATGATGAQGPQGEKGEVLYVGDAEMEAALKEARAKIIATDAKWNAAIDETILEVLRCRPNSGQAIKNYLERAKRRAGD